MTKYIFIGGMLCIGSAAAVYGARRAWSLAPTDPVAAGNVFIKGMGVYLFMVLISFWVNA